MKDLLLIIKSVLAAFCGIQSNKKFIQLKQSKNELKNKLEQIRAIDNCIKINVALASKPSIGVDTMEDYLALKKIMEYKS